MGHEEYCISAPGLTHSRQSDVEVASSSLSTEVRSSRIFAAFQGTHFLLSRDFILFHLPWRFPAIQLHHYPSNSGRNVN